MVRATLAVALADLRRRTRTPTLLVAGVLTAYLGKLIVVDGQLVVGDGFTGVGTAAWYGATVCGLATTVLFVFGFPLARGGVTHDRETGVATLLGTAPLSSSAYVFGKVLSAGTALAVVTAVLAAATTAAFLVGGTGPFDPIALLTPFVLITLPSLSVVAAAAVLTEVIGPLRGTAGTASYVLSAIVVVGLGVEGTLPFDPTGVSVLQASMSTAVAAQYPDAAGAATGFAYVSAGEATTAFRWTGVEWTLPRLAERAGLVGVAVALSGVAVVSFDRFDPDAGFSLPALGSGDATDGPTDRSWPESRSTDQSPPSEPRPAERAPTNESSPERARSGTAEPLVDDAVDRLASVDSGRFGLVTATVAELRMAFRRRRAWYLALAAVVVAAAVAPIGIARTAVVPLGTLVALPALSGLGSRARRHDTATLLFTTASPVRLLVPTYLSGVAVVAVVAGPVAVRVALLGQTGALLGLLGGVCALPAAALASGVWTGRPRVFETALVAAWYLGPVNGVAPLDFVGARPATVAAGVPVAYLAAAPALLLVAAVGRRRVGS